MDRETWNTINKEEVIKQIFNDINQADLAKKILGYIREDDKLEKRNIHAIYANLLCILLAKTHDPKFIEDIVKTKSCGDLFFYVDSNLARIKIERHV